MDLLQKLKEEGIRLGVASSSKNCKMVLEAAGLLDYFETRVDGLVSAEIGLKGKPEPDIFTTACDNLGVAYDRSVVVEDAVSGVQAGAACWRPRPGSASHHPVLRQAGEGEHGAHMRRRIV